MERLGKFVGFYMLISFQFCGMHLSGNFYGGTLKNKVTIWGEGGNKWGTWIVLNSDSKYTLNI